MYLIGNKRGDAAISKEERLNALQEQLKELDPRQLEMLEEYIRGLKAAELFLSRG